MNATPWACSFVRLSLVFCKLMSASAVSHPLCASTLWSYFRCSVNWVVSFHRPLSCLKQPFPLFHTIFCSYSMLSNVLQVFINSTVYERKYFFMLLWWVQSSSVFKLKMLDLYSELTSLVFAFFFFAFFLFFYEPASIYRNSYLIYKTTRRVTTNPDTLCCHL